MAEKTPGKRQAARILVVDDDPRLLACLSSLLEQDGHKTKALQSGRDALREISVHPFDLAMVDLRMPDIDGFEVMEKLSEVQPDCGVIVVSGEASFTSVSRALRRGALDYIRKPFGPEELLAIVHSVLDKRSLIRAHENVSMQLEKSEELYRYIVNSSPDIVFMLDHNGRFCFLNSQVESLLGYQQYELLGRHFRHILDNRDLARGIHILTGPNISAQNPRTLEVRLKTRGSRKATRHFEITAFPIDAATWSRNDNGGGHDSEACYYGTARDVTERKEAEAFINFQAYHDLLTRLPNRPLFKDRLNLAIIHARRSQQKLAVMFLDLDRFKIINDTLGHAMGDRLLQAVAYRLQQCLRKGDTLSRFGGDEFTLLLPYINNHEDAREIARKLISTFHKPFKLDSHEVFVGVSIGIAVFPEAGESMDQLIQNADIAMYHVKARGKDGYRFYSETMCVDTADRLRLERDLRAALDRDELRVFYQPQICSTSNRLVGLEALVRWQHPEHGLLYPRDFLPLAEETKLIGRLSERVLDIGCRDIGKWIRDGHRNLRLAVNVSPQLVEHPRFVSILMDQLRIHNFPPENLEIEITENAIMKDLEHISQKLRELANQGVRIAIDDFGTGYSSLNYIHRLPIHTLKVDQSFVRDIRIGGDKACIVNAIVAMAHGLKLNIVAEGVETEEQLVYLKKLGCHQVQGFYYSPACPKEIIEKSLDQVTGRVHFLAAANCPITGP